MVKNIYELLEQVKKRPALFVGRKNLTDIVNFMNGWSFGRDDDDGDLGDILPFKYLTDHLYAHYTNRTTEGWWHHLIRHSGGDEMAAVDLFFSRLGRFTATRPIRIQEIRSDRSSPLIRRQRARIGYYRDGSLEKVEYESDPDRIYVVEYGNDYGTRVYYVNGSRIMRDDYFKTLKDAKIYLEQCFWGPGISRLRTLKGWKGAAWRSIQRSFRQEKPYGGNW